MAPPTTLKDTRVKRFSPSGLSDSLDATDEFPGACSVLTNLVPDLTTRNIWTCRPAATKTIDFTACPNLPSGHHAGYVSIMKVVGNFVYGMCEDLNTVTDFPFAYNLLTNAWVTVTISGGANYPNSINALSGVMNPPTMDVIGIFVMLTHPGFSVGTGPMGWLNISTPSAPVYHTGDLSGAITFSGLGTIPTWVVQFNQRAYYGVNAAQPSVVASDVLTPGNVTNGGQALTFGDNVALTAAAPLGLSNQLGGIIQSLMVFKGVTNIEQITGDYALSNWTVNTLNVSTGTRSPRSICSTPLGLAFLSPFGLRIIDQNGTVSDPIGAFGKGVTVPFTDYTIAPNSACAGCDGVTLKISMLNTSNERFEEYWFNLVSKVWSGPHSPFTSSFFQLWNGYWLSVPDPVFDYNIYSSPTNPTPASTYTENTAMAFTMQSAMLEDSGQMAASEVAETQVVGAAASSLTAVVNFVDSNANVVNTADVTFTTAGLQSYHVDFPAISVFNRIAIQITGNSAAGVRIGDTYLRLRTLSYLPPPP